MRDQLLRRPKTANPSSFQFAAADRGDAAVRRPGSQMSRRSIDAASPQFVPIKRVPSAMQRSIEVQTDPRQSQQGAYAAYGVSSGQGTDPQPDAMLFQPDLQYFMLQQQLQQQQQQQQLQPMGYASLPIVDPQQLLALNPYGSGVLRRTASARVPRVALYRSGRNGSCWRHVTQCTGNLGNNILFIDGHVKEEDCKQFPPHGYPSSSPAAGFGSLPVAALAPVHSRLAPKPELMQQQHRGLYQSQALQRARAGNRYWVEERANRQQLVPNTIQGRIMKSGSAY